MRRLRQTFKDTRGFESLLSAKELPLVRVVEDRHSCACIFSKNSPENLPPTALGFVGFRSAPTGILILGFIDNQRVEPGLEFVVPRDITQQTRHHLTEVKITLCRAG